jgi:hypothetical protein
VRFTPGQDVLHRGFTHELLSWVTVNRVVSDDERGLLLWRGPGGPHVTRCALDGRTLRDMPFGEWIGLPTRLRIGEWGGLSLLTLVPPGAAHSVWWMFRDAAFTGWYVNLEEPSVRWPGGVDFSDQDLDIVVGPDRGWRWKDEDEFTERLAHGGHYWVRDEKAVRAEGERLVPLIEAGAFPFDGTWCDFRPPAGWRTPTGLPPGWDRPRVR